jgi:hypothetical protein
MARVFGRLCYTEKEGAEFFLNLMRMPAIISYQDFEVGEEK